jgi:hypothetical protein
MTPPLLQAFFMGVALGAAPFLITIALVALALRDENRKRNGRSDD